MNPCAKNYKLFSLAYNAYHENIPIMNNNIIKTEDDLTSLISNAPITVITTYRGNWCPFCRKYLSDFSKAYAQASQENTQILGVSIDEQKTNDALKAKLGLNFELYTDENRLFKSLYNVVTSDHLIAPVKKQHLQPAVFIFQNGVKVFEWIQTPKLKNMGGAASRLPVKEVFEKVAALQN